VTVHSFAVDASLFEAMPKTLRPNIAVTAKRSKIPRGPRIVWLNRAISLYFEFVGRGILKLISHASLVQVRGATGCICQVWAYEQRCPTVVM
jgi:hypothetical protein